MTGHDALFKPYLKHLAEIAQRGDAREETYYGALQRLLENAAAKLGRKDARVTTLPTPTEGGNPDFRVWNGVDAITGYIEAKRPEADNLDEVERSPQVRRYRETFPNFILTNFLEFRLYRNGALLDSARLARPFVLNALRTAPPLEEGDALWRLLERFLDYSTPRVQTAEALAVELAKRTRFLHDVVFERLTRELDGDRGAIGGFYAAFQQFLIGNLAPAEFADLYAQTITYGLFAARTRAENGFTRQSAFHNIPATVGMLREVFQFISLGDLPQDIAWTVDDIVEVLAKADATGILDAYYKNGKGSDPIVHFYETFLAAYNPEERERRGVYYTPEPVVSYIVRSLHSLLKTEFGLTDGLASEGVTLLDPAAGTMTFSARAAQEAVREFERKYGSGGRKDFIRSHILENFNAFELMMAPYAVGHLKMAFFLEELGHRPSAGERVKFYLTNALDMAELDDSALPGLSSLAEESRLAGQVKKETPILVILGNPPYSGHSANKGEWIQREIDVYKQVDGKPLGEKNPKWLQDDYVKFLRFAQWKIAAAGKGVVGMITNHSYLDNPTFRGMRRSLMETFDAIHVLDLHGNSLKRETSPGGGKDENVFDIRQGVAIVLLVKREKARKGSAAAVRHAECWGSREAKYEWLASHDFESTDWNEATPAAPFYLYAPWDDAARDFYESFTPIPEIFPVNSVGIVTARDKLTIHWTPDDVWRTITTFSRMAPELAREGFRLGPDARDWKVALAQQDLVESGPAKDKIVSILYRPFDIRNTYYTGRSRGFHCMPRFDVMKHMLLGENTALIVPKRVEHRGGWQHAWVCGEISGHVAVSLKTIDYFFPLHLYEEDDLFNGGSQRGRQANLSNDVVSALERAYGEEPDPKSVFHYVYAILYAHSYREKYVDYLRMDFPRIPFTRDDELFRRLAELGARLSALHRLDSPELDPPAARFEGAGDGRVGKNKGEGFVYDPGGETLHINRSQYFAPISPEVWEYRVGGYQVCAKWLKDRRGRVLSVNEVRAYCRMITALRRTIAIQEEIDALYSSVEASLLTLSGV